MVALKRWCTRCAILVGSIAILGCGGRVVVDGAEAGGTEASSSAASSSGPGGESGAGGAAGTGFTCEASCQERYEKIGCEVDVCMQYCTGRMKTAQKYGCVKELVAYYICSNQIAVYCGDGCGGASSAYDGCLTEHGCC